MCLHCHWDPLCEVRHGISHLCHAAGPKVSAGEYLGPQTKDAEHEGNHWTQNVRKWRTHPIPRTHRQQRGPGSYLDGIVELLQRTSRALPAADVHTEGIPPHD